MLNNNYIRTCTPKKKREIKSFFKSEKEKIF